ncbi:hypothetical protein [Mesorhizobium sp. M0208]|uniref:hypothetical protein n=1 Tax=Mesorhizobium sp. M0208 TaxID=2956916 RepID=UPI00333C34C7
MSISQTAPKADRVGIAIAAMVFTDLTLSIADAIIKVTISDMPLSSSFSCGPASRCPC